MSTILVTGAAGFIGFFLSQRLLDQGHTVIGLDNLNPYYDVNLKHARLAQLSDYSQFQFYHLDVADRGAIARLFHTHTFDQVVHMAAQAGVRYSLKDPFAYVNSNLVGFINILEGCRHAHVNHLVYASSSSVYGANIRMPLSVKDPADHPISLYAATKKSNELMAHSYSYLYQIPTTGLRFFTVYGPWGRPDMALFSFTQSILADRPISVFNHGKMKRDFTYIDDAIDGITQALNQIPPQDPTWSGFDPTPDRSSAPYRLYNLGHQDPVELIDFIDVLETCLGRKAIKTMLPMQPGDVLATYADIHDSVEAFGFTPKISIQEGIPRFVDWYKRYYNLV